MTETYTIDANGKASIIKDPSENLDYSFDWTSWLSEPADTIATAVFAVTGATLGTTSNTTTLATAFVSGGEINTTATLTCTITTAQGRIAQRSVYLKIKDR
jgi:hypothetical protein